MKKTIFRILAVAVFVAGVVAVGAAYYQSATLKVEFTRTAGDAVVSKSTRLEKPNGDWREVETRFDALGNVEKVVTVYGVAGKGVFVAYPDRLSYIGERPEGVRRNIDTGAIRKGKNFVADDVVAGQPAIRIEKGGASIWLATGLRGLQLKVIDGDNVKEATSVTYTRDETFELPDLPIDCSGYKNAVEHGKAHGVKPGPCK